MIVELGHSAFDVGVMRGSTKLELSGTHLAAASAILYYIIGRARVSENEIRINEDLTIPTSEISYRASRSGGPGGQHVNTSSTRVELVWEMGSSSALTDEQRARLEEKLANRLNSGGVLSLASSTTRSQHRNREEVTARFADILRVALETQKPRRKTRPPRASRENRLRVKKQRSRTKELRRPPRLD